MGSTTNVVHSRIVIALHAVASLRDRNEGPITHDCRRVFAISAPKDASKPRVAPANFKDGAKEPIPPVQAQRRVFTLVIVLNV